MRTRCEVYHLGTIDYQEAWQLQNTMASEIARGERPPALLLLQHPACYTFGRRGKPEHLLWSEEQLAQLGVSVHWVDRGGDVTYHGPGQLVGYPLIPLPPPGSIPARIKGPMQASPRIPQADYMGYLRKLESVIILALIRLGVPSGQVEGLTGVWVQKHAPSRCTRCDPEIRQQPAKIAAMGVKVDARGVTRHGFALNVDPDMRFWEGIIACGLKNHPAASLADFFDLPPRMEQVVSLVTAAFGEVFDYEMVTVNTN